MVVRDALRGGLVGPVTESGGALAGMPSGAGHALSDDRKGRGTFAFVLLTMSTLSSVCGQGRETSQFPNGKLAGRLDGPMSVIPLIETEYCAAESLCLGQRAGDISGVLMEVARCVSPSACWDNAAS